MATTIHSLSYKIDAQTAGFTRGVAATRKELSQAKRIMKQTEEPLERYQREVREADTLLRKGAISQATYNRRVSQLKSNLGEASKGLSGFQKSLGMVQGGFSGLTSALGPAGIALGAFVGVIGGAAMKAGRFTLQKITENLSKLDRIGKISAKLAIDPQALRGLQFAAGALSGIGEEQVATALQRMTRRISEAAADMGEARGALKELGLDANDLNLSGPEEAFRRIADAIQKIDSPADRLRIAFKLFDTEGAGLVTTLQAGRRGIDDLTNSFDTFGGKLSKADFTRIETLNDQLALSERAVEGLFEQLTAEVSIPALALVKELNEQIAGRQASQQGVRGTAGLAGATLAQQATGFFARQTVGGGGTATGQAFRIALDAILKKIPTIIDLTQKHHAESLSQSVSNTNALIQAVEGIALEAETPPGSR